mgnify:CR=1 FL=1
MAIAGCMRRKRATRFRFGIHICDWTTCFAPTSFAERVVSVEVVTKPDVTLKASDHFPLLANLDFR